jgi:hypothetical protein
MRFAMSAGRPLLEDDDNEGANCAGCLFRNQPASVCKVAAELAMSRGQRDCDAVDQFGEVVVYIRPRQLDLLDGEK